VRTDKIYQQQFIRWRFVLQSVAVFGYWNSNRIKKSGTLSERNVDKVVAGNFDKKTSICPHQNEFQLFGGALA
jgi:hypothetical protein